MSTLLITGATGSFGQAFVRRALQERWYDRIIAFCHTETNRSAMAASLPAIPDLLDYFIGDVRDLARVRTAMGAGVDVVIHAAAMKEVPTCAYDWSEAAGTNVDGSHNVAQAALEAGVQVCLLISTDKACEATTAYGKTKAMAEEWFVRANRGFVPFGATTKARVVHHTVFAAVRYGNVLASRGSVLGVFRQRLALGLPLPVVNLEMTRFWWTLGQAVDFVQATVARVGPGQVWVPKLQASTLAALVQAVAGGASDCPVCGVGLRGGEKLHEVLVSIDEAPRTVETPDAFVVLPADPTWPSCVPATSSPVRDWSVFPYRSSLASCQLSMMGLRALVHEAEGAAAV